MMSIKYDTFDFDGDWYQAFGRPEKRGVWLIWGQSGNGKTSFVMQLCKYLCRFGRVAYNSLEEGASLTMQNSLKRFNMMEVNRRFLLIDAESMEQLDIRLHRQKSPDFVVIDSFQYTMMSFKQYVEFKEHNKNKLLIFISHADGKLPAGTCRPQRDVQCRHESVYRKLPCIQPRTLHRTEGIFRHLAGRGAEMLAC